MSPFPLQIPDPLPPPPQPERDDIARPVIILVLDPEQQRVSWRFLTRAEAVAVIARYEIPTLDMKNYQLFKPYLETR
jgi:hypothetical protein